MEYIQSEEYLSKEQRTNSPKSEKRTSLLLLLSSVVPVLVVVSRRSIAEAFLVVVVVDVCVSVVFSKEEEKREMKLSSTPIDKSNRFEWKISPENVSQWNDWNPQDQEYIRILVQHPNNKRDQLRRERDEIELEEDREERESMMKVLLQRNNYLTIWDEID